jgi:hypothetical protein
MAYGVIHHFPGGTQERYDATVAVVHPSGGGLPDGQVFHAAGASDGGWNVVVVYDSQEGYESFRDGTLIPSMGDIEGGFDTPPQETTSEVHNLQP